MISVSNNHENFFVLCEGSIVYQFEVSNNFKEATIISYLKDKKINVFCSISSSLCVAASLYNENKKDDRIFFRTSEEDYQEIFLEGIAGEQRVLHIYTSNRTGYILLGFFSNFFFFLIFSNFFFFFLIQIMGN